MDQIEGAVREQGYMFLYNSEPLNIDKETRTLCAHIPLERWVIFLNNTFMDGEYENSQTEF